MVSYGGHRITYPDSGTGFLDFYACGELSSGVYEISYRIEALDYNYYVGVQQTPFDVAIGPSMHTILWKTTTKMGLLG